MCQREKEKKEKHPQAGTLSVSGNKIHLESLTSLSPPKAFQGFLFLCKGWATVARTLSAPLLPPPRRRPGCGGECRILWGTASCVIKPHLPVTLFNKRLKEAPRSWRPLRNSQSKRGHMDCFSTLVCLCYGPNSTRNSRKMCTCRIYAFLLKGWGEGRLFTFGKVFFFFSQSPFSTVSVWF